MSKRFAQFVFLAAFCLVSAAVLWAQVSTTGTLQGTVTDPTGAVVAGASVKVADQATGAAIETASGTDGRFVVANLKPGNYTVTVTVQGFKTGQYRDVTIVVGGVYDLPVKLAVGAVATTVTVEAGAVVLETSTTTVGTTIMGKAITQLPFTSRDALDLAILMPGAQTTGRPRATSFMGLPKGSINITYDGINAQDNLLKSSDGFFTIIRPRVDGVEEFSISTAAQGAEQAGEGAVQIRFETKRGGNDYHGGLWYYYRNKAWNSNFYFNNLAGRPRQSMYLSEYGYKIGGPILKDKLFFFTDFDFYSLPQSLSRTKTILTDDATRGLFTYAVSSIPSSRPAWVTCNATASTCTADLMAMAAARGFTSTVDSVVGGFLTAMNSAVSAPGVGQQAPPSLFQRSLTFNNPGTGKRKFPDFRFDWNISQNHQFTAIYHYQHFTATPDFLNGFDQTFPVAPFNKNQGSQISNRNEFVGAWRWNIGANKSNDLRIGFQSSPVSFFPDLNLSIYPQITTNLGTIHVRPRLNLVSQPLLAFVTQGRNAALGQWVETFSWTRGKHALNFGGSGTEIRYNDFVADAAVAGIGLGLATTDPARGMFSSTNLPGASTSDRGNARALYGMLAGRISNYTATVYFDPKTRQFKTGSNLITRVRQRELGFYGTDSYRLRPSLTLNYGLRWEYQGAPQDRFNEFFRMHNGFADVFGISGLGNLFKPGTMTGSVPVFELNNGRAWYDKDLHDFAPSIGLAWQPGFSNNLWKRIFGEPGRSVFRGGYSMTYSREGLNNFFSMVEGNPGYFGSQFTIPVSPSSPPAPGTFPAGSLQLQSLNIPTAAQNPASFTTSFTIDPTAGQSVNVFQQNLRTPRVQSWSVGIQRELTQNMVFEVRYVGNHGTGLWRQDDLNEVNIFENGFLTEFVNAKNNLAICRATPSCASSPSFANRGLAGQVPLPIFTAVFTGSQAPAPTDPGFTDGFNIGELDSGLAGDLSSTFAFDLTSWQNLQAAGLPANFWIASPHVLGSGSFRFFNGTHTSYNGLQIEMRRRPAKGLQFSGNYTFSKSLSNYFADNSFSFVTFDTLRNPHRDRSPSPWDLRHQFKLQLIYELPFGPGHKWSTKYGFLNRVIEGWEFSSITRWQSGRTFRILSGNGGTFNQYDPGVQMIGITPDQLQQLVAVRKAPGKVFYFPPGLLDSKQQRANSNFLKSCAAAGQFCQRLFLRGPQFFRADWSILKRTRIGERMNIEYRAEFLNAFNNVNFLVGGSAAATVPSLNLQSTSFGRITSAYQDISTTDDPGGRIIQMVLRLNF